MKQARLTKFAFHVHKPKAMALAKAFANGCRVQGYDCLIIPEKHTPRPDRIGIFYGVVPETYAAFSFYRAEGRAIYLDNGWLSTPELPTFRFSWNSAQPFLRDMPVSDEWDSVPKHLPVICHEPKPNRAMLVLQSRQYFENMRLGYTRDQWQRVVTKILAEKGYAVHAREKPTKKEPEAETFFDHLSRAEILVSLNSASTVKALRYGIPAFCLLDCTPSPLAPISIPQAGRAAPPDPEQVDEMCARMWSYEVTREQLGNGKAIDRLLSVPNDKRKGYWYAA